MLWCALLTLALPLAAAPGGAVGPSTTPTLGVVGSASGDGTAVRATETTEATRPQPGADPTPVGPGLVAGAAVMALGAGALSLAAASGIVALVIAWTPLVPKDRPGSYSFTGNFGRTSLSQNFIFLAELLSVMGAGQLALGALSIVASQL